MRDLVLLFLGLRRIALRLGRGRLLLFLDPLEILAGLLQVGDLLLELFGGQLAVFAGRFFGQVLGGLFEFLDDLLLFLLGLLAIVGEQLVAGLFGRFVGLLQGLLGLRRGLHFLLDLGDVLGDLLLRGGQVLGFLLRLGRLVLQLFLAMLDLLENVAGKLLVVVLHQSLGPLDDFQKLPQAIDHLLLARGGVGEMDGLEELGGVVQLLVHAVLLEFLQSAGRLGADRAAPGAGVDQHLFQTEIHGLHVPLVLEGGQRDGVPCGSGLLGDREGRRAGLGLQLDQPQRLGDHLRDPQPAEQGLPLGEKLNEDLAALVPDVLQGLFPQSGRFPLDLAQEVHHLRHLVGDQQVDVLPHLLHVAVDVQQRQPVVFQLLDLYVEDASDHVGRYLTDPFLRLLLRHQVPSIERLRGEKPGDEKTHHQRDHPCTASDHGPPPTSS